MDRQYEAEFSMVQFSSSPNALALRGSSQELIQDSSGWLHPEGGPAGKPRARMKTHTKSRTERNQIIIQHTCQNHNARSENHEHGKITISIAHITTRKKL